MSETVCFTAQIQQIEYLVMPSFDPYIKKEFAQAESDYNKALYHSGTFYANGVSIPKRPKNLLIGQSWRAPNKNQLTVRFLNRK